MKKISRDKAIESGERYYYTGKPCIQGHIAKRYVLNGRCWECQLESCRKSYQDRKAKIAKGMAKKKKGEK